ncbi:MAG: hypothetical protein ABI837_13055 [Acidobacteriota bacterium]
MRAATLPPLIAALLLAGCASGGSDVKRCTDFSGLYTPGSCRQHEKKPLTDIRLPDDSKLSGVTALKIQQTNCSEIRISSADRADIILHPDEDSSTHWTEDGRLTGGSKPENSAQLIPGFGRSSRVWHLATADSGNGLVYTDGHDERGLALLLIPFHEHIEAECDWVRVKEAK